MTRVSKPEPRHVFVRSEPEPDLRLRLWLRPKMINTKILKILITEQNVTFFRLEPEPYEPELLHFALKP